MAVAARSTRASEIPFWTFGAAAIGIGLALLTPNEELTIAAVASLAAIILLLRRRSEPAALLFIFGMQWLQGSLKVFHADVLGVQLWTLTRAHSIEAAVYLTLAWAVFMAAGARVAMSALAWRTAHAPAREHVTSSMGMRELVFLYAAWSVSAVILRLVAADGALQIVLAFANLRWAVVFAIFVVALKTRRGLPIMWAIFAFELASGFLSFFSTFKIPLFLLTLAAVSAGQKFSPRQILLISFGALTALYFGVVWSAIKMEYRDRLNQGTGAQVVTIDKEQQISELLALFGTVDSKVLGFGFEKLVERIAYVDYFAYTLDYVPTVRAHEGGKLWSGAVQHILMPRLLFPDKVSVQSDTEVMSRYTGFKIYYSGRATSITIGLPAITYVDFGAVFMFGIAVLVGLLHGAASGYFWSRAPGDPLAQGFATAVILQYTSVGSAADKLLGGQVTSFLVAFAIWKGMPALLKRQERRSALAGESARDES